MLGNIIKMYRIGKELGLTRREIKKILLFDNSKHPIFYNLLIIIALVLLLIFSIYSIRTILAYVFRNTYARGTMYSTINIKDFQNRDHLLKKFIQTIKR